MASDLAQLRISLLGGLSVTCEDRPSITFSTSRVRALLVLLALRPDRQHQRSALAELFWPERPERTALSNLRQVLKLLRQDLGEVLARRVLDSTREGIMLRQAQGVWIDVASFCQLLRMVEAHEHPAATGCPDCVRRLEQALALYEGDLLGGSLLAPSPAYDELIARERAWLYEQATQGLRLLTSWSEARQAYDQVLSHAQRWLELDPWCEQAHYYVLRITAARGQRAAALAHYERHRAQIKAELGLEPAAELARLAQHIRTGAGLMLGAAASGPRHNLPALTTSFVGRQQELLTLTTALGQPQTRLLTLTGPGGAGKTRLALQSAQELTASFRDGVWLISLAGLGDPALLASTIAHELGLRESSAEPILEQLKVFLRDKQQLLLLDNLEHLVEGAAVIGELLAAAPELKILATSRVLLRLYGEHELVVPPLALPAPQPGRSLEELVAIPSVALFSDRARAANGSFLIGRENRQAVEEICVRLDGLPLAIELAAAHMRQHSAQSLLGQLRSAMAVLTGGPRDHPARHQTLRATIDWSYRLLAPAEQRIFARLGVFRGGADEAAIEAICGLEEPATVGAVLASLAGKSMAQRREAEGGVRFMLLETMREYALERLAAGGELELLQRRHAAYYDALVAGPDRWYVGMCDERHMRHLRAESDNFRAALEWTLESDELDTGLSLLNGLWLCWYVGGFWREGCGWIERFLSREREGFTQRKAGFYWRAAFLSWSLGRYPETIDYASAGRMRCEALGNQRGALLSQALLTLGTLYSGDLARARSFGLEALALGRRLGEPAGVANALIALGHVAWFAGDVRWATAIHEESLRLARELDDLLIIGFSLTGLERALLQQGRPEEAQALCLESRAIFQQLRDRRGMAKSLTHLGQAAYAGELFAQAESQLVEGLSLYQTLGDRRGMASVLTELGLVALAQQRHAAARRLLEESLALSRELKDRRRVAIALANLALAYEQGRSADGLYRECLLILRELDDLCQLALTLERVGLRLVAEKSWAMAAMLFGAAEAIREQANAPLNAVTRRLYQPAQTTLRQQLEAGGDLQAWNDGRALAPRHALDLALASLDLGVRG